jgi:hypothetical protein
MNSLYLYLITEKVPCQDQDRGFILSNVSPQACKFQNNQLYYMYLQSAEWLIVLLELIK